MHMKTIGLYTYLPIDDPESVIEVELPKPKPTGRDLLVHVKAVSARWRFNWPNGWPDYR